MVVWGAGILINPSGEPEVDQLQSDSFRNLLSLMDPYDEELGLRFSA